MKCKLCLTDKPKEEFYRTGTGGHEKVCKQCVSLVNKALRAYLKWAPQDRAEWPPSFLADVKLIASYVDLGGQPPQRVKVESMLKHLQFVLPEAEDPVEVSAEAFLFLMRRVEDLEARLLDDTAPQQPIDKLHTRWADAMAKLTLPQWTDDEVLAWKGAMSKLKAAISYGHVISPTIIRDVVVPLEADLIPWPSACDGIYSTYIRPALDTATQCPGYPSMVEELVDLTSRNYYELEWPLIPYDARDEGIF